MDDNEFSDYAVGYGPGYPGSPFSSETDNEPVTPPADYPEPPPAVLPFDSGDGRRLSEVYPEDEVLPGNPVATATGRRHVERLPPVGYLHDPRRVSLHPAGVIARPIGVPGIVWNTFDKDSLLAQTRDLTPLRLTIPESPVAIEPEKKAVVSTDEVIKAMTSLSASSSPPTPPPPIDPHGDDVKAKEEPPHDPSEMPFLDHLEEFRWVILKSVSAVAICLILGWFVSDFFISTVTRLAESVDIPLSVFSMMEAITVRLRISFVIGLAMAAPFIFYFVWSFVSPGLYSHEKRWILPLIYAGTACFIAGASLAFLVIIPFMLKFVKAFIPDGVQALMGISTFIDNILKFSLAFGIIFEMPFVSYILAKIGLIKHQWLSKYRGYAVVVIFIIAAIFTPPDPVSQFMMGIPLVILYEVSILVARFAGRKTLIG